MEKTMYDNAGDVMKRKKDSFTLDFSTGSKKARGLDLREGLLSSPDVGLLKLATPELERFIIHHTQSGTLVQTPTQILFPKSVTEEQEAYARGFVDALVELHMKQSPLAGPGGIVCVDTQGSSYVTLTPVAMPQSTIHASVEALNAIKRPQILNSPVFPRSGNVGLSTAFRLPPNFQSFSLPNSVQSISPHPATSVKSSIPFTPDRHPQPVATHSKLSTKPTTSKDVHPNVSSSLGVTPSFSPIDMSNQERIKLDRKREKNRNAAQKCRSKKMERISRLEERVAELKAQNAVLAGTATGQRDQVNQLRQQIVDHVNSGCQIMIVRDS